MVYKPLAGRVVLNCGVAGALPVFNLILVVVDAMVMWESRGDFQGV